MSRCYELLESPIFNLISVSIYVMKNAHDALDARLGIHPDFTATFTYDKSQRLSVHLLIQIHTHSGHSQHHGVSEPFSYGYRSRKGVARYCRILPSLYTSCRTIAFKSRLNRHTKSKCQPYLIHVHLFSSPPLLRFSEGHRRVYVLGCGNVRTNHRILI